MMTKDNQIWFFLMLALIFLGAVIVTFQFYLQNRYLSLVQEPHFIEDFMRSDEMTRPLLKDKYDIDYAVLRSGRIVQMPDVRLPHLELSTVSLMKNPLVLQNTTQENLMKVRPYVFRNIFSFYLLFPLVFPEKEEAFLIIKKITP